MILKMMLVTLMTFTFNTFAVADDSDTAENYKKYKGYAAPKKERLNNKWSEFKKKTNWDNLSDEEKKNLKKKVYDKSK